MKGVRPYRLESYKAGLAMKRKMAEAADLSRISRDLQRRFEAVATAIENLNMLEPKVASKLLKVPVNKLDQTGIERVLASTYTVKVNGREQMRHHWRYPATAAAEHLRKQREG